MSVPYQPVTNPMGQGFSGSDPNLRVPRQNFAGDMVQVQPGANAGFYGSTSPLDSPLDFIDDLVRREDFPPGPQGDEAYRSALVAIGGAPAPTATGVYPGSGRNQTEQDVFNANQTGIDAGQGGSAALAVISWASNHPEQALSALMAMSSGAIGDPTQHVDDATIRDIVTGLGGVDAVNAMIAQKRQELQGSGVIPPDYSGPQKISVEGVGDFTMIYDGAQGGNEQWMGPDGKFYTRGPDGDFVLDTGVGGQDGYVSPGPNAGGGQSGLGITDLNNDGIPDRYQDGIAPPLPTGTSPPPNPNAVAELPAPTGRDSFQIEQNGQVVGTEPLSGQYQYTALGNDVYLDVTDPGGQVRRFTGDVVQAAYSMLGYSSFDEMVLGEGYPAAIQILMGFVAPPSAQTTPGAGPGGVGPVQPVSQPPAPYFPTPVGPDGSVLPPTAGGPY